MSHAKNTLFARFPIATALRETLAEGYGPDRFKRDLSAAFVVSLVALPLSMALAIAVGLPPQHGLYTAIVAGFLVPLLGGSRLQVSGPTAAFVVILAPIVAQHGLHGLIWCQLLAGVFLLVFWLARLGKLISYVPYTVTTGFTAGIAVILGIISLNDFLGLGIAMPQSGFPGQLAALTAGLANINPYEAATGIITLLLIIYGARITRHVPPTILGVGAAIGLSLLFGHMGHGIDTIADRFSYVTPEGAQVAGIPPYPPTPHLPTTEARQLYSIPTWQEWSAYIYPALIIAVLAALESLLSATVSDSMARTRHNPNAELAGIGIGNLAAGMFAGIPATGALARTAALVNNGGTSPIASSMHALMLLAYMMLLAPYIGYMPMTALAAILIHTAVRMSHWRQCIHILQIAPRSEIVVLLSSFAMTILVDMVAGIAVGMAMSAMLLMQRVTDLTRVERHHNPHDTPADKRVMDDLPANIMYYRIKGPLFFSTTQRVLEQADYLNEGTTTVVIDLTQVDFIDMSGVVAVTSLVENALRGKKNVVLSCPETMARPVKARLKTMAASHDNVTYTATTMDALLTARKLSAQT